MLHTAENTVALEDLLPDVVLYRSKGASSIVHLDPDCVTWWRRKAFTLRDVLAGGNWSRCNRRNCAELAEDTNLDWCVEKYYQAKKYRALLQKNFWTHSDFRNLQYDLGRTPVGGAARSVPLRDPLSQKIWEQRQELTALYWRELRNHTDPQWCSELFKRTHNIPAPSGEPRFVLFHQNRPGSSPRERLTGETGTTEILLKVLTGHADTKLPDRVFLRGHKEHLDVVGQTSSQHWPPLLVDIFKVDETVTDETLQEALLLWDPLGEGALRSATNALEAAQAL